MGGLGAVRVVGDVAAGDGHAGSAADLIPQCQAEGAAGNEDVSGNGETAGLFKAEFAAGNGDLSGEGVGSGAREDQLARSGFGDAAAAGHHPGEPVVHVP